MERFFTYFSIKFDNLYLKWNFLRIWLWKWKKWILFYKRSSSQIILIENTKLLFFFFLVYIYNLSNKKCVYIIKKRAYVYIYMCVCVCVEVVLINVLASHLAPPNKNSWLRPWVQESIEAAIVASGDCKYCIDECIRLQMEIFLYQVRIKIWIGMGLVCKFNFVSF